MTARREGFDALIRRQARLHEERKLERMDVGQAMAIFDALIRQTAAWDALRGIDPMNRWRRGKEEAAAR